MATTKHETAEVLATPATHHAHPRRKLPAMTATSHHETYREQNLMNSGEIRTMASDAVLIVSGNQQPALIPSKGYFEVGRLRRATRIAPVPVEVGKARGMEWVGL